jgi:hypothetical protein
VLASRSGASHTGGPWASSVKGDLATAIPRAIATTMPDFPPHGGSDIAALRVVGSGDPIGVSSS